MTFNYSAKDSLGHATKGKIEATNISSAAAQLQQRKLIPLKISEDKGGFNLEKYNPTAKHVGSGEISSFTRQLATMMNAGLPLTDALNLLKIQSGSAMSAVVGQILVEVQAGVSLSAAMSKHPSVFSKVYVALVKVGEAAGVMETVLSRLADVSEKNREFKGKVVGALIYPIIVLVGMVGVMTLMMVVVVPKLTTMYADYGSELPIATKIVVGLSDFMSQQFLLMVVIIAALIFIIGSYIKTAKGRWQKDTLLYKLPVWGPLSRQTMLVELTRTLGLLVGAGVSVVEALGIVAGAVGNITVETEIRKAARQVEKGFPLSVCFTESPLFPPVVGQMIAVGEETGKMDDVLSKLSHYFEADAEEKIKGLTTAIEPIILIVLALGVGFLMYAIIMPIYGVMNKI